MNGLRPLESKHRRGRGAVALIVLLAISSIILIFIGVSATSLSGLKHDLKLVEEKQQRRWAAVSATNASSTTTNSPAPDTTPPSVSDLKVER